MADDLVWLKTDNHLDHSCDIKSIGCLPNLGLYITGCSEGYVKIWNVKKALIREIKFLDPVQSVTFLNEDGDILVGHSHKVSMISQQNYFLRKNDRVFRPDELDITAFYVNNYSRINTTLFMKLKYRQEENLR